MKAIVRKVHRIRPPSNEVLIAETNLPEMRTGESSGHSGYDPFQVVIIGFFDLYIIKGTDR